MIEELTVIVNELYEYRHDAKFTLNKCSSVEIGSLRGMIKAYSHAIKLLDDLIDKHEGVKGED
jgi:hypothetical protein